MICLSLSDISLSFLGEEILSKISFSINDCDKVGVIGVNGAGKTSLFRIICGEYEPDLGEVYIAKGHTVGMLAQNPDLSALPGEMSVIEYMYRAHPELIELEEKISALEAEIASLSSRGKNDEAVTKTSVLVSISEKFSREGGMEYRARCRSMLISLGFSEELIERKISSLSGGQYTRLALARLLVKEPDILMLDEPTNHLDIDALTWLENYLTSYKKTLIIISHDRYFLDKVTSRTLHIQYGRAELYNGNYSTTKELQMQRAAELEHRYREQQKEIAKIRANIEFQRRCNREHNFVTIRSKEKQLARMEKIELAPKAPKNIRMTFAEESSNANDVLTVDGLRFSYGEKKILDGISFMIRRGERVLFLGSNGCGKSTLMKLINGRLTPSGGKITLGYNIKIGYYDQENRGLCESKTVFEELHDEYPDKTNLELRSTLALFLFDKDDIEKTVSALSGGERARLTLAKLILKKVNLLVMDEPTNHLDIGSCEALENALMAFDGTIIAVSHDRYFINSIATRIIELDPNSSRGFVDFSLEDYDEAYSEYMRIREQTREARASEAEKVPPQATESKLDYEARKREAAEKRREEKRIERARARASELEAELEQLESELFSEAASDYIRAAAIEERRTEIELELMELYEIIM